jgi:hypothetical protein
MNFHGIAQQTTPLSVMESATFATLKLLFEVFSFEPWRIKSDFEGFWSFLHVIFFAVQFFVILKNRNTILYTFDRIGKFSDLIKFFTTFCAYTSGLLVSYLHKRRYQQLLDDENKLEKIMKSFQVDIENIRRSYKTPFARKFFYLTTFQVFIIVQDLYFKKGERQTLRFILSFTFPAIYGTLKFLQAVFYIDMKTKYFKVLNEQISSVKDLIELNDKNLRNHKYNKFLFRKLEDCQKLFRILVKMTQSENRCAGVFYLANQINLYVHILCSLYWMAFRMINLNIGKVGVVHQF